MAWSRRTSGVMADFCERSALKRTKRLPMLERLRPIARRIAPSRWLSGKRSVLAATCPEAPTVFPSRLNVGCGYDKRAGYLNIDIHAACEPDILIRDGDYSAIPHDHFEEVYAHDVLEHFPRRQTLGVLLDWASWLKTGGKLLCQTTSILGAADHLQRGTSLSITTTGRNAFSATRRMMVTFTTPASRN